MKKNIKLLLFCIIIILGGVSTLFSGLYSRSSGPMVYGLEGESEQVTSSGFPFAYSKYHEYSGTTVGTLPVNYTDKNYVAFAKNTVLYSLVYTVLVYAAYKVIKQQN